MGLAFEPEGEEIAQQIMKCIEDDVDNLHQRHDVLLTPDIASQILALWTEDKTISHVWKRRREFRLSCSTEYFLDVRWKYPISHHA